MDKSVFHNIKESILLNKFTLKDISEKIGMSENGFGQSLNNETLTVINLLRIADVLGIKPINFFSPNRYYYCNDNQNEVNEPEAKRYGKSEIIALKDTYRDYLSYPKNLQRWLNDTGRGNIFIYELDRKLIVQFLDHIYIDRNNSATTRNNYLSFLRTFASFLVENDYQKTRFTEGINNLKRSKKKRARLSEADLERLRNYLQQHNPYFLLACEIQYYTFIRPKELSMLKISDIDFINGTIRIKSEVAKNRQTALVTVPKKLHEMMYELNIHNQSSEMYLFSDKFKPGLNFRMDKHFRDYWLKLRGILQFPDKYQFYSLKDTGITDMLHHVGDTVMVRDQARHSNIAITNLYTHGILTKANETIKNLNY